MGGGATIDDVPANRFTTRDFELTDKGRRYYGALLRSHHPTPRKSFGSLRISSVAYHSDN